MPKRPPKHWFKRCVKAVKKRKSRVIDPKKICGNNWHNRMSADSRKKALREEKKILAKRSRKNMAEDGPVFNTYCEPGEGDPGLIDCETYQDKPVRILDRISDFMRKATGRTRARKKRRVVTSVKVCKKVYLAKDKFEISGSSLSGFQAKLARRLENKYKFTRAQAFQLASGKQAQEGWRANRSYEFVASTIARSHGHGTLNAAIGKMTELFWVTAYNTRGRQTRAERQVKGQELEKIKNKAPVNTILRVIYGPSADRDVYIHKTSSGWHKIK